MHNREQRVIGVGKMMPPGMGCTASPGLENEIELTMDAGFSI
jgi:hypothetical protein